MSDSQYSDLTDLESDDYSEKPKKKLGAKQKGGVGDSYRIKNALHVPRATTYTAQALYDQIHSNDIDLEPEYQRDVVWPETKQIGIIDSIFRNFYVPPVIFAANSFEDGSETKTCIDGKQRLTSIQRFMDGLIPHKDPLTGEKLWYKENGQSARARRVLPDKYRRLFANKQIVCVEYQNITDSDEREIFQRVQLGMALTPAEKLQVINTPRASFIRELQALVLKEDGGLIGDALDWDRGRGADFRCLSQGVFCMEKFDPALKNAGSIPKLEKWLSEETPFTPEFKSRVKDTYHIFSELVLDDKLNKVFKKPAKVSPIEFILIPLLVNVHMNKFSRAQLSAAIGKMRNDVRDAHVDIRMNDRVAKTMLDHIRTVKPSSISGDAGVPAAVHSEKRKREDDDGKPKFKKMAAAADVPPVATPKPLPSAQPAQTGFGRMAAIRAAKIQAAQRPAPPQPSTSQSGSSLQTNYATGQLPSPRQDFAFPNSSTHAHVNPAYQSLPQRPSLNPLETSLMARATRPPSANDNRHISTPYDHGPSRNYGTDSTYPPKNGSSANDKWPSNPVYNNRQSDSGWGSRGR